MGPKSMLLLAVFLCMPVQFADHHAFGTQRFSGGRAGRRFARPKPHLHVLGLGFECLGLGFEVLGRGFEFLWLGLEVLGLGFDDLVLPSLARS